MTPFIGLQEIIWRVVRNTTQQKYGKKGRPSKKPREVEDHSAKATYIRDVERYDQIMKIIYGDAYEDYLGRDVAGCTKEDQKAICDLILDGQRKIGKKNVRMSVRAAAQLVADHKHPPKHEKGARKAVARSTENRQCFQNLEQWYKRYGWLVNACINAPGLSKKQIAAKKQIIESLDNADWPES